MSDGEQGTDAQDEVERLRAERDKLAREVETLEARPAPRSRLRRVTALILVIVTVASFAAAVPGAWARRTVFNQDRYVAVVGPLASDPAVQEVLARQITAAVFEALDVQGTLATALEDKAPRLTFLAGPITNSVQGFVEEQVLKLVQSEQFQTLWVSANRSLQSTAVLVLNGGSTEGLSTQDGKVVINYLPIINQALQQMAGTVGDLIGRPITLPEITPEMTTSTAVTAIASALNVTLPENFGTVVVYDSNQLAAVQDGVHLFNGSLYLLIALFFLGFIAAMWVSPRRRRTLLQLTVASAVFLVLERRLAIAATNDLVNGAKPENQAAARAIVDAFLGSLLRYTGWLLAAALLTAVIAVVTGPYPWARTARGWIAGLGRGAIGAVHEADTSGAAGWVGQHRDAAMAGGAAVIGLLLLVLNVSLGGFLLLAIVLVAYEVFVYRVAAGMHEPTA